MKNDSINASIGDAITFFPPVTYLVILFYSGEHFFLDSKFFMKLFPSQRFLFSPNDYPDYGQEMTAIKEENNDESLEMQKMRICI
jgi:hypothetical protein